MKHSLRLNSLRERKTIWETLQLNFSIIQHQQMQVQRLQKLKNITKPFARKIQILTVGEQRAKVMGKSQSRCNF